MSNRGSDWQRRVVQAVADRLNTTGENPTLGELAAVLGWPGSMETRRKSLAECTNRGLLVLTTTMPRRIRITALGAELLKASAA